MKKERIYYFDMAKGIGIILVVLAHAVEVAGPVRRFITSFHMPLFFIISGMLIAVTKEEERTFLDIAAKKFKSIMIPYISFSALYLLVEAGVILLLKKGSFSILADDCYRTVCLAGMSVFWFLPALFFSELLFILIEKLAGKRFAWALALLCGAGGYLLCLGEGRLYMQQGASALYARVHIFFGMLLHVLFAVFFVALGYYGQWAAARIKGKQKVPVYLVLAICLFGITLWASSENGMTDMNYMVFNNIFLYTAAAVCGSFGVIALCGAAESLGNLAPFRLLMYYGRNSLIIMVTHMSFYILYVGIKAAQLGSRLIGSAGDVWYCLILLAVVFILESAVIEIVNRFFPFLTGKPCPIKRKI